MTTPTSHRALAACRVIAAAAVVALSIAAPSSAADPAHRRTVQTTLDRVVASGAPGAIALTASPRGVRAWSTGYARLRPRIRMRAGARFRIASITKPFVATVALQLVAEGKLTLNDSVEQWLPGALPDGAVITIQELLGHRSGLADWVDNPNFLPPYLTGRRPLGYQWSPDALLGFALTLPRVFAPGAGFWYSNTNYLLLREIIERTTGDSFASQLQRRILGPLGLHSTAIDDGPGVPASAAHGYVALHVPGLRQVRGLTDTAPLSGSGWWGGADMVSTARDLARFFRALLARKLVRPDLLGAMTDTPSGPHYGLGLDRRRIAPCPTLYGHTGSAFGNHISLFATRDGRLFLEMMNTDDPGLAPKTIRAFDATASALANITCRS
jgi:D-alanyl-D-alanine carboxypeptidase